MMQPTEIHETIAAQVANMKPDHLQPGVDVGMDVVDEHTLAIVLHPSSPAPTRVDVRYDRGPDTYTITRMQGARITEGAKRHLIWVASEPVSDIYCDQLGELVFGDDAKPFSLPMGGIQIFDEHGNLVSEETF